MVCIVNFDLMFDVELAGQRWVYADSIYIYIYTYIYKFVHVIVSLTLIIKLELRIHSQTDRQTDRQFLLYGIDRLGN